MPSLCRTPACAARQDKIVEAVLLSAQSKTLAKAGQYGSLRRLGCRGSVPVMITPSNWLLNNSSVPK